MTVHLIIGPILILSPVVYNLYFKKLSFLFHVKYPFILSEGYLFIT